MPKVGTHHEFLYEMTGLPPGRFAFSGQVRDDPLRRNGSPEQPFLLGLRQGGDGIQQLPERRGHGLAVRELLEAPLLLMCEAQRQASSP